VRFSSLWILMTEIAAIVPMRHKSERVPGKNYRVLGDRPLFAHIVDTLLTCPSVTQVAIDTDSSEIRRLAHERYGSSVRLLSRPEKLAGGHISMNDVLGHSITQVIADLYLQTHSTNPLLTKSTIESALSAFMTQSNHDALISVTRIQTRLYAPDHRPLNHDPANLVRTQDLEPVFEENSCLYVFKTETLRETGQRTGKRPMLFEVSRDEAWDIDEEFEFRVAECLWKASRGST
jgi:CMP-N-acetylneuraminic acid synthetase